MKKLVKFALALFILGMVIFTVGIAVGGKPSAVFGDGIVEIDSNIKKYIGSAEAEAVNEAMTDSYSDGVLTGTSSKSFDKDTEIDCISLGDISYTNITLQTGDEWRIDYNGKGGGKVEYKCSDSTLTLSTVYPQKLLIGERKLTLTIPKDVKLDTMDFTLDDCDLTISDALKVKNLFLTVDDCDIDIANIKTSKGFELTSDDCDCTISAKVSDSSSIVDSDSDIDMTFLKGSEIGSIETDLDDCSFELNANILSESASDTDGGQRTVISDKAKGVLKVDGDDSDITLTFPKE